MNTIPSFVKADIDLLRFFKRTQKRNERYPNWRQVYYDCNGFCQYPINIDNVICGETDTLEFHEMYDDEGKVFQIALLCNYHHRSVHNGIVNPRYYKSKLQLDVELEMKLSGSLEHWKIKYGVIEREIIYDFTNDSKNNTLDLKCNKDC